MGLPLGLGKPNRLVNALYQRLRTLPERQLTLYTALSLGRPPLAATCNGVSSSLSPNGSSPTTRSWITCTPCAATNCRRTSASRSSTCSPAACWTVRRRSSTTSVATTATSPATSTPGVNAVAQLVARHPERPGKLSLACNPDITLDLLPMLEKRRAAGETIVAIGMVHDDPLPYLPGDAEVEESVFDLLIDAPGKQPAVLHAEHAGQPAGSLHRSHASALVRDGGTLQIGIGSMGDALTAALLPPARQRHLPGVDRRAGVRARWAETVERERPGAVLAGAHGCSEMFVLAAGAGRGRRAEPPGHSDEARQRAAERGEAPVEGGVWLHGGFFLGPLAFYRRLREMSLEERAGIGMTGIGFVNNLYRQEELKRLQRRDARFINSAFIVTFARRRGRRPAGGRPGAQWRRRAVQLRRPGPRAGGRTFDPDAA